MFDDDITSLVIVERGEMSSSNSFALKCNPCGK